MGVDGVKRYGINKALKVKSLHFLKVLASIEAYKTIKTTSLLKAGYFTIRKLLQRSEAIAIIRRQRRRSHLLCKFAFVERFRLADNRQKKAPLGDASGIIGSIKGAYPCNLITRRFDSINTRFSRVSPLCYVE